MKRVTNKYCRGTSQFYPIAIEEFCGCHNIIINSFREMLDLLGFGEQVYL
jgi:hypothetical protein